MTWQAQLLDLADQLKAEYTRKAGARITVLRQIEAGMRTLAAEPAPVPATHLIYGSSHYGEPY